MSNKKPLVVVLAIVVLVALGLGGAQLYVQNRVETEVAEFTARWEEQLPPGSEIRYGDVSAGFLASTITVSDVRVEPQGEAPLSIEEVHVAELDKDNQPPHYMNVAFRGLEQQLADMPAEQAQALRQMGYERLRGDMQLGYRYDESARQLVVDKASATFDDVASIDASLTLSELDLEQLEQNPQQPPTFKLASLGLRYQDRSLINRAIKLAAEEEGVSEQEVREQMIQEIETQSQALQGPFYRELAEALKQMVREPGTLVVKADPETPVATFEVMATAMMQPMRLPELLNLSVSSN
jgi:hypothetical protein